MGDVPICLDDDGVLELRLGDHHSTERLGEFRSTMTRVIPLERGVPQILLCLIVTRWFLGGLLMDLRHRFLSTHRLELLFLVPLSSLLLAYLEKVTTLPNSI